MYPYYYFSLGAEYLDHLRYRILINQRMRLATDAARFVRFSLLSIVRIELLVIIQKKLH